MTTAVLAWQSIRFPPSPGRWVWVCSSESEFSDFSAWVEVELRADRYFDRLGNEIDPVYWLNE